MNEAEVVKNKASGGFDARGGGIYNDGGTVSLDPFTEVEDNSPDDCFGVTC